MTSTERIETGLGIAAAVGALTVSIVLLAGCGHNPLGPDHKKMHGNCPNMGTPTAVAAPQTEPPPSGGTEPPGLDG